MVSSQPCPFAEEIVPAHRHEKGMRHKTDGMTSDSAPTKAYLVGTNCMIKKKTAGLSDQSLKGNSLEPVETRLNLLGRTID